jgi:hypothetical protein
VDVCGFPLLALLVDLVRTPEKTIQVRDLELTADPL